MKITDLFPVAVDLQLNHPVTGDPLGVSLKVVGPDSVQFRNARNEFLRVRGLNSDKEATPDELQGYNDKILASLVIGWSDTEFFGGEYSPTAALNLISTPELGWLRDQLSKFTDKRTNFFRTSEQTA